MELEYELSDIKMAAEMLIPFLEKHPVIALHGEMGAGKTTLVSAVCSTLGMKDMISSPTFSIINEYAGSDDLPVFHIDLYRMKSTGEALEAGLPDCLDSGNICFVEWPELASSLLPADCLHVYITIMGGQRRKLRINS
jgi:tRNA threonylcarbamoyladenosine biosynthesis protein TsaE